MIISRKKLSSKSKFPKQHTKKEQNLISFIVRKRITVVISLLSSNLIISALPHGEGRVEKINR